MIKQSFSICIEIFPRSFPSAPSPCVSSFNKKNLGLSRSFISGISYVLKKNDKIIVLEDDNEVSKYFLNYINDALLIYNQDKKVCSISGYSYPIKYTGKFQTFFIKGADTWGWATWKRAWKNFDKNGKIYESKN